MEDLIVNQFYAPILDPKNQNQKGLYALFEWLFWD